MERYVIPSVVHACEVLKLLSQNNQGITMQDINEQMDLPRTTLFRLLRTLSAEKMVDKRDRKYFCGTSLMQMGFSMIHSNRMHQIAIPHVQRLALKTGYTAHLAVPHNGSVLIVEVYDSPNSLMVSKRPGVQAQMHCTATGKVFLAHLYYDNLALLMNEHPMEKRTKYTITDLDTLRKELERVEALGYAVDELEYNIDVRCLAVPVRDNRGIVVAALGVTAPAVTFAKSQINNVAKVTKEVARGIYVDAYQLSNKSK